MSLDENVSSTWSGDYKSPIKPPETADVVIIGGGIIGVSTAYFLAKDLAFSVISWLLMSRA